MHDEIIINGKKYSSIDQQVSDQRHKIILGIIRGEIIKHAAYLNFWQQQNPRYVGKLYPAEALSIIELSRTQFWPTNVNIDKFLSYYLLAWLEQHGGSVPEYTKQLFRACDEQHCTDGIYYRLNLSILVTTPDKITIDTRAGSVTKQTNVDTLSFSVKTKIKGFLAHQGKYRADIKLLYLAIDHARAHYTLEQALLSWLGSLVVRSAIEMGESTLRLADHKLLTAQ